MPTTTLTTGNDTINNNSVFTGLDVQTIVALAGDDTIIGSNFGDDVIYGGDGADSITSNGALSFGNGDLVYGGDGDDIINTDLLSGGVSTIADTVFGGAGNDFIVGAIFSVGTHRPTDSLFGGTGNDTIDGNGGPDSIDAGAGNDLVIAREGADTVDGGSGIDTIDFTAGASVSFDMTTGATTMTHALGSDIESNINFENVIGTSGSDTITGTSDANVIETGAGNDTIFAGGGDDELIAGAGDDSVDGGAGFDTLDYSDETLGLQLTVTGAGEGFLSGPSAGDDDFEGIELLILTPFSDGVDATGATAGVNIELGAGDDVVLPGLFADTLDGGAGIDRISFINSPSQVNVNNHTGISTGGSANGDQYSSFEDFILTPFGDTFVGSDFGETVDGASGNDSINGGAGNDTLLGDLGDDTIQGNAGADSLSGGGGVDTLSYLNSDGGVTVSLNTGAASGAHAAGDNLVDPTSGISFENLSGSQHGDVLEGTIGINVLSGAGGNDSISALGSSDTVFGGEGADTIDGGLGSDTIDGGNGDDSLNGGGQRDTISFASATTAASVSNGVSIGARVNLGTTGPQDTGYGMDTLVSFEDAEGTQFVDFLFGGSTGNSLYGGGDGDLLNGREGNDVLYGGDGFDILIGGAGADEFFGGAGVGDLAAYFGETDGDPSTPGVIDPLVFDQRTPMTDPSNLSSAVVKEDTVHPDVEGFAGSFGLSNVFYTAGPFPYLLGGNQNDTFFGGTGVDQLIAQGGDDLLIGGLNQDALNGGNGDDDLWGGLQGGTGDGNLDLFLFDDADGDDTIHDFEAGTDAFLFYGDAIAGIGDLGFSMIDTNGDMIDDSTVITYIAAGLTSTITVLNVDQADVQSSLILF